MADGTDNGWQVRKLATHGTEVHAVVGVTVRGRPVVVTAGNDGAVRTWDLESGEPGVEMGVDPPPEAMPVTKGRAVQTSQPIEPDPRVPTALAVVPGEESVVHSGWSDGTIRTLDVRRGLPGAPVRLAAPGAVSAMAAFAGLGQHDHLIAAVGNDAIGSVAMPGGTISEVAREGLGPVWSLAVSETISETDDDQLVYAGSGNGVERWLVSPSPDGVRPSLAGTVPVGSADRSPLLVCALPAKSGDLVVGTNFDRLDVWMEGPRAITSVDPEVGQIRAITAVTIEGRPAVAVGGESGLVAVVDPSSDDTLVTPVAVGEAVTGLAATNEDVLLVGGRDGGVFVVEAVGAARMSDQVELQDDLPAVKRSDDRLRRSPLAEALAVRLRRRHQDGKEASFLVHLDGRWGSGKTTVLNFVADELGDGWTIVRYNAWRQARIGPPWWTLLTALRIEMLRRRSLRQRAWLWARELFDQRIWRTSGLPATALLLLLAAGVFMLVRPEGTDVGDALTTVQGVAATLTALATLFAGAEFVGRFFSWHSPRGAKAFEDLDANPMDRVASHFSWLVRQEKRPIAFFVDDIDRCSCDQVVDLLEAVQTLVRDAGESEAAVLSPCFVVAGDGAWIRNAFEERYNEFSEEIGEPGRPLGYLFLAKIFQLTMPVPRIGPVRQSQFFRELLGLQGNDVAGDTVSAARVQVEAAPDDEAQQQVLAQLPQEVREEVAPVAVRRQTERAFAEATEHRLTGFAPFLPDNPRAVKRFLNAFALNRSVRTVEGQAIPTATLALWTILETRWPELADCLSDNPVWIERPDDPPPQVPDTIRRLLADPAVQTLLGHEDGGPLTAADVVACRGG